MPDQHVPAYSLDVTGLTDSHSDDPTSGVQFGVTDPNDPNGLGPFVYGDQRYVASGEVFKDVHAGGRIQRRTITITYGEWEDHDNR